MGFSVFDERTSEFAVCKCKCKFDEYDVSIAVHHVDLGRMSVNIDVVPCKVSME